MPPAELEPRIPASEWPQMLALDRLATEIGPPVLSLAAGAFKPHTCSGGPFKEYKGKKTGSANAFFTSKQRFTSSTLL